MAQRMDERAKPWVPGLLRVFISHTHVQRVLAGSLGVALRKYGIDAFVAHDDIAPTREWENEIIAALRSCDVFVVLMSDDAPASKWVDQESGWAMGRGIPFVSVHVGLAPYGFMGRYQALKGEGVEPAVLARQLFDIFRAQVPGQVTDALVGHFEASDSFDEATDRFRLLLDLSPLELAEPHLDRIEAAYTHNRQITEAFYVRDRIGAFLERHRRAWDQWWEAERRAQQELDP